VFWFRQVFWSGRCSPITSLVVYVVIVCMSS